MKATQAYFAGILLALIATPPAHSANLHQVQIESGRLQGVVSADVLSFKGVPFAKPPVGDLRWRAPQPAERWAGVRKADQYGHDCMQLPFGEDAAPLGTEPSEDCLVLNVWRPADARKNLPVMVWIYGGGLINGGSSPGVYDGSAFARQGIVFVSFNYRLGRFGFFAHPGLRQESPSEPLGNYGYLDQIAALKWIHRNIAAFGGDPRHVTVFGESAGGGSVHMLMTSPLAHGLFQQAIVESGGGRSSRSYGMRRLSEGTPDNPSAEEIGVLFAQSAGITESDPIKALAALRKLSGEQVIAHLNLATLFTQGAPKDYSGPMLDGRLLVEDPSAVYASGRAAKVPMIVGANDADIGFAPGTTVEEVLSGFGANRASAASAYGVNASTDAKKLATQVGMDRMMVEPARFIVRSVAASGTPAYEFRFAYVATSKQETWSTGAPHATEIPYVFDTVATKYGHDLTPRDAAMAALVNRYWGNFVKSGDPNGTGLPHWSAYEPSADQLMIFESNGMAGKKPDPWRSRLDLAESRDSAQGTH